MKTTRNLIISLALILFCGATMAQTAKTATPAKVNGPEIKFDKSYFDFGTVKVGEVKTQTVTFTNIGNKPLLLDNVISSCDCTEVEWSKAPVMPGKTGTIKAIYTAKNPGIISKRVTVDSNAETDRVILQLKGQVK